MCVLCFVLINIVLLNLLCVWILFNLLHLKNKSTEFKVEQGVTMSP